MLHVTTEVGKPGKKEREKRHFPLLQNQPGDTPAFRPHGRKYIPHQYSKEDVWRPHNQNIDIEYTEAGPDWSSQLKYLPDPENPDYPAAEIWPNNWKAMRPYPFTYKRSRNEWLLDPGLTKVGLKCTFNGVHRATAISEDELTHSMRFGKGRNENDIDKRNSMNEAAPGDKSYQAPEYSPSFHSKAEGRGSATQREPYIKKAESRNRQDDIDCVKKLDSWQPAKPISSTIPQIDPSELKKY